MLWQTEATQLRPSARLHCEYSAVGLQHQCKSFQHLHVKKLHETIHSRIPPMSSIHQHLGTMRNKYYKCTGPHAQLLSMHMHIWCTRRMGLRLLCTRMEHVRFQKKGWGSHECADRHASIFRSNSRVNFLNFLLVVQLAPNLSLGQTIRSHLGPPYPLLQRQPATLR
jgi:hypothetical protein